MHFFFCRCVTLLSVRVSMDSIIAIHRSDFHFWDNKFNLVTYLYDTCVTVVVVTAIAVDTFVCTWPVRASVRSQCTKPEIFGTPRF